MSPFEFLEDLKRDRSSSLETLHHMLRCAITGIILLARFGVIDCDARTVATRRCGLQWWAAASTPPLHHVALQYLHNVTICAGVGSVDAG